MTVEIGTWFFPLLITIASLCWLRYNMRATDRGGGGLYSGIGDAIGLLFYGSVAVIVSLIAWLIWALMS